MDKEQIVRLLQSFAEQHQVCIEQELLGILVSKSTFRVVSKGEILSSMGDDTALAGLVLSGMARCYYIDDDGNDITRGFAPVGAMCMDEGFFGYPERLCMWETLEESTIMFCETAAVKALIHEDSGMKDVWITLLESAMRYKVYRENGFLVESATERYLHFKKRFPATFDQVPQKHIATYLGIAPESLSRIRRAMKEDSKDEA